MKFFLNALFILLLFVISPSTQAEPMKIDKETLKNYLFSPMGSVFYKIGDWVQGFDLFEKEYYYYIKLNYNEKNHESALKSVQNRENYLNARLQKDLMIYDALTTDMVDDPVFQSLLREKIREAIVKAYLYKKIPSIEKIKEAQFSDDKKYLEDIYEKNKKQYDDKNISREEALKALQNVYAKKKNAIIEYLLKKEEDKILESLKTKLNPFVNKQFIESLGNMKP